MISLYYDKMISLKGGCKLSRKATFRADRTRQVQFRMNPDTFKKLHIAVISDDDISSMADFFNSAAEAYLKNPQKYTELVSKIAGGKNNETISR